MKYFLPLIFFVSSFSFSQTTSHIHIDQFGYFPDMTKVAIISNPQIGFNISDSFTPGVELQVVDANSGQVVYQGAPVLWNGGQTDLLSGDSGWQFDFSSVVDAGTYTIFDPTTNEESHPFEIHNDVYDELLMTAGRMFYYNRCGIEKPAQFAGANWVDAENFNHPLQDQNCRSILDPNNSLLEKDLSGGWFDAGDYNKYITFTENTLHDLLSAYEENAQFFTDDWNIPESGNGIPDILDEIKWELDWMMKMTNADGSVHIKMGNQNYAENTQSPPSVNMDQRFYGPTCSSASVTVAGVFAHAAVVFESIASQSAYAAQLLARAELCYNYGLNLFNSGSLETDCDDLSIVSGDADRTVDQQTQSLIIASLYLFESTGNSSYEQFFISQAILSDPLFINYWVAYFMPLQDAILRYTTYPNADPAMNAEIMNSFNASITYNWNDYYGTNDVSLYRDFMPEWAYHWGSNRVKLGFGQMNIDATRFGGNFNFFDAQNTRASAMLQSLHGVNPMDLVYLSNMSSFGAENSIQEVYHGWFYDQTDYDNATTSLYGPAPGFVVGGPNANFSVSTLTPPFNQPAQKSYLDFNTGYPSNAWEVSEPAIYYQAAYIRLLSSVMSIYYDPTAAIDVITNEKSNVSIYPNPTTGIIQIFSEKERIVSLEIYDPQGRLLERKANLNLNSLTFSLNGSKGVYLVRLELPNGEEEVKRVIVN